MPHHQGHRTMEIRVLGPVEASADGQPLPLGGAKQRAVMAMLGLEANRTVTADHLIEGLWGERAPASAPKMVQNYVWRLRTVLNGSGTAEIVTRGSPRPGGAGTGPRRRRPDRCAARSRGRA